MALVTRGDAVAVWLRLLNEHGGLHFLRRLFSAHSERVKLTWQQQRDAIRNWYEVPEVLARHNLLITGERNVSIFQYVARQFDKRRDLDAVSLGCGGGSRELEWAATGRFKRILGIDISEARISQARKKMEEMPTSCEVEYVAGDVLKYPLAPESLDVVIAEEVLHHLTPLSDVFDKIRNSLKPGGLLIINDYVGPDRFQWTRDQVRSCNALLSLMPANLRTYRGTSMVKSRVFRPGTLSMKIHDPSEAVEPSGTTRLLRDNFEVVFQKDYGGAILHPLLKDIAHHFVTGTPEADAVLQFLFEAEDYLMKAGIVGSDFTFVLARKV